MPIYGWLLLLGVLVVLAYWPGFNGGYVFDDFPNIVDNAALHVTWQSTWQEWLAAMFSSPASELQRPLAMLTFAINHAITGLDPYWMKATNVSIHLLNAWLVFGLSRVLLDASQEDGIRRPSSRENIQAFWISGAWALNPINLLAVLFIVQRMESLCHTFVFAGLWMYLAGRRRLSKSGSGLALMGTGLIGGTVLGMAVKESAALLPLYALTLEWAVLRFDAGNPTRNRWFVSVFAVLTGLSAIFALAWQLPKVLYAGAYLNRPFTLSERLFTESRVLVDYFQWTVLPNLRTLSLYHDDYIVSQGVLAPPSTLASLLFIGVVLAVAIWIRKRRPLMALGLIWFLVAHLLTGTILPLELVYEHRNYFASFGLCLALADVLLRVPQSESSRRIGGLVAVLLLAYYAGLTSLRAYEWRSVLSFSISEAAKHPLSPRASYALARDLVVASNYDARSPYFAMAHDALDKAMKLPGASTLPEAAAIMTAARSSQSQNPAWWISLIGKLHDQPIGPQQTASLASLVDCDIKFQCHLPVKDMTAVFTTALARGPNAEVMNIYGNYALNRLNDPSLALQLWRAAADQAPNVVAYQQTLAKMFIATGRPDLARAPIARIRKLGRLGQNEAVARDLECRIDPCIDRTSRAVLP